MDSCTIVHLKLTESLQRLLDKTDLKFSNITLTCKEGLNELRFSTDSKTSCYQLEPESSTAYFSVVDVNQSTGTPIGPVSQRFRVKANEEESFRQVREGLTKKVKEDQLQKLKAADFQAKLASSFLSERSATCKRALKRNTRAQSLKKDLLTKQTPKPAALKIQPPSTTRSKKERRTTVKGEKSPEKPAPVQHSCESDHTSAESSSLESYVLERCASAAEKRRQLEHRLAACSQETDADRRAALREAQLNCFLDVTNTASSQFPFEGRYFLCVLTAAEWDGNVKPVKWCSMSLFHVWHLPSAIFRTSLKGKSTQIELVTTNELGGTPIGPVSQRFRVKANEEESFRQVREGLTKKVKEDQLQKLKAADFQAKLASSFLSERSATCKRALKRNTRAQSLKKDLLTKQTPKPAALKIQPPSTTRSKKERRTTVKGEKSPEKPAPVQHSCESDHTSAESSSLESYVLERCASAAEKRRQLEHRLAACSQETDADRRAALREDIRKELFTLVEELRNDKSLLKLIPIEQKSQDIT
ncbi:unnamed protein product [Calicophoron daubneyi]|uniref:Uncharacterized protein n=1 Tax=Calicophoron daubneyi TaxID=300641 RepID=A0AAV2TYI3_CALDB